MLQGPDRDGERPHAEPAEPTPPTSCRSVEPVRREADPFSGPHSAHFLTVSWFETRSGFGYSRMAPTRNGRGVEVASPSIDRVELVSLLTDSKPAACVLDEMGTPSLAHRAELRPLDEFERLGLDAVVRGAELVWTREAPRRMFGAIRACALSGVSRERRGGRPARSIHLLPQRAGR